MTKYLPCSLYPLDLMGLTFEKELCYDDFLFQEAVARLEEFKKSMETKMALRRANLNPERPG